MNKFFKSHDCLITYEIMTKKTATFHIPSYSLKNMKDNQELCYIDLVETKKRSRNHGHARYALNEFLSEMNKKGVYGVFLFANYDDSYYDRYDKGGLKKLVKFYKSFGFEISDNISFEEMYNDCQINMHRITM